MQRSVPHAGRHIGGGTRLGALLTRNVPCCCSAAALPLPPAAAVPAAPRLRRCRTAARQPAAAAEAHNAAATAAAPPAGEPQPLATTTAAQLAEVLSSGTGAARRILSDPAIEGDPLAFLRATEAYWKARWDMARGVEGGRSAAPAAARRVAWLAAWRCSGAPPRGRTMLHHSKPEHGH
jgi:hypothetical protein